MARVVFVAVPGPQALATLWALLPPPYLFLAVRLLPLQPVFVLEKTGIWTGIVRSWRLSGPQFWALLRLVLTPFDRSARAPKRRLVDIGCGETKQLQLVHSIDQ